MDGQRFGDELAAELEYRGLSQRDLAKLTRSKVGWGSPATIARLVDGSLPPTMRAMEAISKALNMRPEKWTEYQLAKARRDLDPGAVGIRRAYRNLRRGSH
jgi:transcriptional regulator with XRE-family HTH domain